MMYPVRVPAERVVELGTRLVNDIVRSSSTVHLLPGLERYRYHDQVLMLQPWEEIYTVDDERTMSFADTFPFHDALVDAYERTGYIMVEVPRGSVEHRAAFVRDSITGL